MWGKISDLGLEYKKLIREARIKFSNHSDKSVFYSNKLRMTLQLMKKKYLKKKHFVINELLEGWSTAPQNLDKLGHPIETKATINNNNNCFS